MIDLNHLPEGKHKPLLQLVAFILAVFNINSADGVLWFFGEVIIWGARIFVICTGALYIYDYFIADYRYRQWAKGGFKKEEKNKYRIK